MYKKIYLEITNVCNLACDFCIKNKRAKKYLNKEEFEIILDKLKGHTKYLYFHILGEPLIHPKINEFIDIASKDFFINITTNGYLIKNIINNKNIRQINISLHSFNDVYQKSLDEYMNDITEVIEKLSDKTYFSLRFWTNNSNNSKILNILNKKYNLNLNINNLKKNNKIKENVFLNVQNEFIWPDLNNNYYNEDGTCYALKDHLGVLSDGTIVPCCLDSKGDLKLGNIFKEEIADIEKTDLYQKMLSGFKNNKKVELLCKKCRFLK